MIKEQIIIINKLGLHARAAGKLVSEAAGFSSQIKIGYESRMVDAKSIMSVMLLAASQGTSLEIEVDGPDEDAAYTAIANLINNRFDEGE
ncbi:MAG: HPr family phosphocarrier protein [Pseudomonadales bacterium]|nr:HPr family phosphocarrier protein [Pseudomonadales bacterium]